MNPPLSPRDRGTHLPVTPFTATKFTFVIPPPVSRFRVHPSAMNVYPPQAHILPFANPPTYYALNHPTILAAYLPNEGKYNPFGGWKANKDSTQGSEAIIYHNTTNEGTVRFSINKPMNQPTESILVCCSKKPPNNHHVEHQGKRTARPRYTGGGTQLVIRAKERHTTLRNKNVTPP